MAFYIVRRPRPTETVQDYRLAAMRRLDGGTPQGGDVVRCGSCAMSLSWQQDVIAPLRWIIAQHGLEGQRRTVEA